MERMEHRIETPRLVLFPYTAENLALFNRDLPAFEAYYGVAYRGEELDHLLTGFLKRLEREIAADPEHFLFFTEFLIVCRENDHIIGSIDYKYIPENGCNISSVNLFNHKKVRPDIIRPPVLQRLYIYTHKGTRNIFICYCVASIFIYHRNRLVCANKLCI